MIYCCPWCPDGTSRGEAGEKFMVIPLTAALSVVVCADCGRAQEVAVSVK